MAIERSKRRVGAARMAKAARRLLDTSALCAIATVAPDGRAHVNTAYFAWSPTLDVVWLSEPRAKHSRNIRANDTVAIAVYDSSQSWGKPDAGIQLFGSGRELESAAADYAERLYVKRFADYRQRDLRAYRFYLFHPRRIKIFDERGIGAGVFVTARVAGDGRLVWQRTEIYRSAA